MKKISILLAFGLLYSSFTTFLVAHNHEPDYEIHYDDEDDFSIDTQLNGLSLENTESIDQYQALRSPVSNADKIYFFFSFVDDPNALLNTPIYQRTSILNTRTILEYPFALMYGLNNHINNALTLMLYFNSCSAKNFTEDSTALKDYFLLGNPKRIAILQNIDDIIGPQTIASLAKSLALFDPATIEERRMGALFSSRIVHNRFNITIQLPILYTERNLQLTASEQFTIKLSPLWKMLENSGITSEEFKYEHFVMDQFGFGDLKFKVLYSAYSSENLDIDCGGFIILPTATALKKGMMGTWIDVDNNGRTYFDLSTIDLRNITTQNQDDIVNYFLDAMDKLNSNLLCCPLGNRGHVAIAPKINTDWYFAQNWKFGNYFSLLIPLPALEPRYFQKTQSESDFINSYNIAYNTSPLNFVYFVNQKIQDLFFPYVLSTIVFPGIEFNSTHQFIYNYHDIWHYYFGTNFWYKEKEILCTSQAQASANFNYDYQGAVASSAAQEKLFGKISYNTDSTNYSWSLSLYGDITVWSSGIGNDFTLGLRVDCNF